MSECLLFIGNQYFLCVCTGQIRTIKISRKLLLEELLSKLGAPVPTYDVSCRGFGFYAMLKTTVHNDRESLEPIDIWICSDGPFCTAYDAEEDAARRTINCLRRKLELEVDDVNWADKYMYHCGRFNCARELRNITEENASLREVVMRLRQDWKATLGELNIVHDMAYAVCCTAFDVYSAITDSAMLEVLGNVTDLEQQISRVLTEATSAFNDVSFSYE